jgi:hypothetical protein
MKKAVQESTSSGTGKWPNPVFSTRPASSPNIYLLIGDALQDRFATFTRELVDRGNRVLAAERS